MYKIGIGVITGRTTKPGSRKTAGLCGSKFKVQGSRLVWVGVRE